MMLRRLAWLLTLAAVAAMPLFVVRFSLLGLPTTVLEVAIIAAVAATAIAYRRDLQRWPTLAQVAALWVTVGLVSALYSPHGWNGLGLWRAYFLEATLLAACVWVQVDSPRRIRQTMAMVVGIGTAMGIYAIYQHFTGYGIPKPWQEESVRRVTAWLGYPNAVGLLLAPIAGLAAGAGLNTEAPVRRYTYWFAALIMAAAVFFARSEGGLVGIGAGLVTMGVLFSKQALRVTLAIVVAGAVVVALVPTFRSYAVQTLTLNDCPVLYQCSLSLRRAQWAETWTMLTHGRWLYGAGLDGYQMAMLPYHNHPGIEVYLYPHNILLNFWVELGLAGLLTFLALVALFWHAVSRALRGPSRTIVVGAAGAMATLLVHGLVDVPYFKNDLSVLFWVIILVPFLANRIDGVTDSN